MEKIITKLPYLIFSCFIAKLLTERDYKDLNDDDSAMDRVWIFTFHMWLWPVECALEACNRIGEIFKNKKKKKV